MTRKRLLTGDRPTGPLHLGHYLGSLANRVKYQDSHECYFVIADLHTLTTRPGREQIQRMNMYIHQIVLDYLSVGIDPDRSAIFVQSSVPGITELSTLLGMLTSVPRLERVPSLKQMASSEGLSVLPFGLLGYPVLMAADILIPRAHLVPVGTDNQGNVELARELTRRFNNLYGEVFPVPELELEGTLVGTDGQAKMSKSLDNAIFLSDSSRMVEEKVMSMYTDPNRTRADIPGQVEGNPVFRYHEAFNNNRSEVEELKERYRRGKVGDVDVKARLAEAINDFLDPVRERRQKFASRPEIILEILQDGSRKMQDQANQTLEMVREAMGLQQYRRLSLSDQLPGEPENVMDGLAFM